MKNTNHPKRSNIVNLCLFTMALILILSSCDLTVRFNGDDIFKSRDRVPRQIKKLQQKPTTGEKGLPLILRDSVFDLDAMRTVSLEDLLRDTLKIIEFDRADIKKEAPGFIAQLIGDSRSTTTVINTICVISRMTPGEAIDFKLDNDVPFKIYLTDASLRIRGAGKGPKSYIVFPKQ